MTETHKIEEKGFITKIINYVNQTSILYKKSIETLLIHSKVECKKAQQEQIVS